MRRLVALMGIALSCAGTRPNTATSVVTQEPPPAPSAPPAPSPSPAPSPAPAARRAPPAEARDIDWCDRAYPWSGGPLTSVLLKNCAATYQETRLGPGGEHAAWTWRIEGVRQDPDGKVVLVTLEMQQSIGSARAVYRRTYRFFREGRAIALMGADPVVRIDEATPGGAGTPQR